MGCSRTFAINKVTPPFGADQGMDQAVYYAGTSKIYAVRGQWVIQCNATTGAIENAVKFCKAWGCEGTIATVGTNLYCAAWRGIIQDPVNFPATFTQDRDIFVVNPATLVVLPLGIWGEVDVGFGSNAKCVNGFSNLMAAGSLLAGIMDNGQAFTLDPSNPVGTFGQWSINPGFTKFAVAIDTAHGVLWNADQYAGGMEGSDYTILGASGFGSCNPATQPPIYGVAYCPVNTKLYGASGTPTIYKGNVNEAVGTLPAFLSPFTWSTFNLALADATPINVRYNPYNNLLYVPCWNLDTVVKINPATDLVVATQTGFSGPVDVVFTPTKAFAVQSGVQGLREIL